MKKVFLVLILLIVISIFGCSTSKPIDSFLGANSPDASPVAKTDSTVPVAPLSQSSVEDTKPVIDVEVSAIFSVIAKSKSFSYTSSVNNVDITIKGDKRKIDFQKSAGSSLSTINKEKFNVVFIDRVAKTAYGICVNKPTCDPKKKIYYSLDYSKYNLMTSDDKIKKLANSGISIKVTSSQTCEGMKCSVLSYIENGRNMEMIVNERYGIPYEIRAVKEDGSFDSIESYTGLAFDTVKTDADVMVPKGYVLTGESAFME